MLFAIGTVGVLVRKNALVIFMSVELQLNAVNLALVAFSRMHGNLNGQVAGVLLDGRGRGRGGRRAWRSSSWSTARRAERQRGRRSRAAGVRRVLDLVWLIPRSRSPAPAVNLLARHGGSARPRAWLATALVGLGVRARRGDLFDLLGLPAEERVHVTDLFEWISVGTFRVDVDLRVDPLSITMLLVVTGVGSLIHLYAIGYMEHDPRFGTLLRLPEPVRLLHADARPRGQLPPAVPRVGGRRPVLVPADRVLVRRARRPRARRRRRSSRRGSATPRCCSGSC